MQCKNIIKRGIKMENISIQLYKVEELPKKCIEQLFSNYKKAVAKEVYNNTLDFIEYYEKKFDLFIRIGLRDSQVIVSSPHFIKGINRVLVKCIEFGEKSKKSNKVLLPDYLKEQLRKIYRFRHLNQNSRVLYSIAENLIGNEIDTIKNSSTFFRILFNRFIEHVNKSFEKELLKETFLEKFKDKRYIIIKGRFEEYDTEPKPVN
jgi:hypothetical protein